MLNLFGATGAIVLMLLCKIIRNLLLSFVYEPLNVYSQVVSSHFSCQFITYHNILKLFDNDNGFYSVFNWTLQKTEFITQLGHSSKKGV